MRQIMKYWYINFVLLMINCASAQVTDKNNIPSKAKKQYEKGLAALKERKLDDAIQLFEKAIDSYPSYSDAAIRLVNLYDNLGNSSAIERIGERYMNAGGDKNSILYHIAKAEYALEKYTESKDHLSLLLEKNLNPAARLEAEKLLSSSDLHINSSTKNIRIDPLQGAINTSVPEYLPALSADGNTMVFTRRENGQEDLYISYLKYDLWEDVIFLEGINTSKNEGAHCYSVDGKVIIFTQCENRESIGSCDLYFSQFKNGSWSKPRNMGSGINSKYWDSQPNLSADKRHLLFSSKRPVAKGDKSGIKNIFISSKKPTGEWSKPELLSRTLSTAGNEEAPYLHADMQTLYFMSDGMAGFGGADLYMSKAIGPDLRTWSKPINLGKPINSKSNEGALFVDMDGKTAYFDKEISEGQKSFNIDIFQMELPAEFRAIPCTYIKANILDAVTKKAIKAQVTISPSDANNPGKRILTAPGSFLLPLALNDDYIFHVDAPGYIFHSEYYSFSEIQNAVNPINIDIELLPIPKIEENKPVVFTEEPVILKNIFFETGSARLKESSLQELKKLKSLLDENKSIRIKIFGHTDNVGGDQDNITLSVERALSVKDWLIMAGIAANRLQHEGFGESKPIASNDNETGRKTNRRTEFVIW